MFRNVLVVTGDHSLPEPTRWDGVYSADDLELHDGMCRALRSLPGYEFDFLTDHSRLLARLRDDPPDFVLNLCDTGYRNIPTQELHVAALYEIFAVPYSGATPAAMVLAYDKAIVRLIAAAHGVPVPDEIYLPPEADLGSVEPTYPLIIKPAQGDGSVGITRDAVVHDRDSARRYLDWFRGELPGRPALLQEYLPGTEYGLALVGNPGKGFTTFPGLQVDYSDLPQGLAPILAFESKTGPETPYQAVRVEPMRLPEDAVARLVHHCETLFERLGLRDYARFDFRTGADGIIKLMEVNPNPAWSATGKLALMAGFGGRSYPQMLAAVLAAAQRRLDPA